MSRKKEAVTRVSPKVVGRCPGRGDRAGSQIKMDTRAPSRRVPMGRPVYWDDRVSGMRVIVLLVDTWSGDVRNEGNLCL